MNVEGKRAYDVTRASVILPDDRGRRQGIRDGAGESREAPEARLNESEHDQ